ncbi:MAG: DUF507 family protein [Helicobacteraceae bacterium]|jgi:hypothetical protein|nr:DUF507 family protein [Helicobacteraceae bacterium]
MRLSSEHIRFIAEKIARELVNSKLVSLTQGDAPVIGAASKRLEEEFKLEKAVDGEVNEIIDELEDRAPLIQSGNLRAIASGGGALASLIDVDHLEKDERKDLEWLVSNFDPKKLFWLIKRKIAADNGLILDNDGRANNLAHRILDDLYESDLIRYADENRVKNLIAKAILEYGRRQEDIEERVHEKLKSYKRNLVRGTEEYDILFAKYYEEELRKLGL